ncbi:MAG: UDP-glucose dehydrogenase family protein, partial [Vicinamibacterales bacterium]
LRAGRLRFTTAYQDAIPDSHYVFICVDTPSAIDGESDMRAVRSAAAMIGAHLTDHTIIIDKSTMPIGASDVVSQIISQYRPADATFAVVSNPEFLREGLALHDVFNPSRIVLGADDHAAAEQVAALYGVIDSPTIITDRRSAEMIKYAANAMLATRISFINVMAQLCDHLGADIKVVAKGIGSDPRIGPLFLEAGLGFGGSCFPKDVKALAYMAEESGCDSRLLRHVLQVNYDQRRRFARKLTDLVGNLHGKRIGLWGLAFKQDTDDIRESPGVDVLRTLLRRGAIVTAYDPAATENARRAVPEATYVESPYLAVEDVDALLIATAWNEFRHIDLGHVRDLMRAPVVIDGRNLYEPAEMRRLGFVYAGIGRGVAGESLFSIHPPDMEP